ncbi:hypothetical protein [Micromonospora sp. NPDC051296]|uniref:hypothetical protein n=1 Tax=Micromonospora sp. NPDC051296 TaxID=3155046 RepID=UPI00343100D3
MLIEMRAVFDLSMRIAATEEDLEFIKDPRPVRWITTSVLPSAARSYAVYAVTCSLFVLGELAALMAVMAGTQGWLPWLAAPASALSAASLVILAVYMPFKHLSYRAWLVSLEREVKRANRAQGHVVTSDATDPESTGNETAEMSKT